jgi:hypothetical protein
VFTRKRLLIEFRRVTTSMRDTLSQLVRHNEPWLQSEALPFLKQVGFEEDTMHWATHSHKGTILETPIAVNLKQESLMKARRAFSIFVTFALCWSCLSGARAQKKDAPLLTEGVLGAKEVGSKLFPDKVFFRGQVASSQERNTGGVRYADGFFVLASLVDNSGYSTGIREKYQAYLITEVPIEIGGQTLKPGAYGCGFIDNNKFIVMDLGANDLFTVASVKDGDIKHPVPLQFLGAKDAGTYRLYHGRDYVEFRRAK